MKIVAQFAPPIVDWVKPGILAAWLVTGLTGIGVALLIYDAHSLRAEMPALRERLEQTRARLQELNAKNAPIPSAELSEVRQRVATINALAGIRGWPAPLMLAKLEQLVPDSVYLVSFNHKLREGEVQLIAESTTTEALTQLLMKLEKEPHFTEVMLVRQSQRGRGDGAIQFELRLKERS